MEGCQLIPPRHLFNALKVMVFRKPSISESLQNVMYHRISSYSMFICILYVYDNLSRALILKMFMIKYNVK